MDIIELARELGAKIQEDERYLNLKIASQVNDSDENLQTLINEFNLKRINVSNELSKSTHDDEKIKTSYFNTLVQLDKMNMQSEILKCLLIAWREDTYFPVVGVLWKACTGQIEPRYTYMGWFCIGIFAVYGYMLYRKYYSMAVFGIISLLVPLTSHVMSTCRFTVGSFVVYMGVYEILKSVRPKIRTAILIFFAFAQIWLLFMWYNSDCWLM